MQNNYYFHANYSTFIQNQVQSMNAKLIILFATREDGSQDTKWMVYDLQQNNKVLIFCLFNLIELQVCQNNYQMIENFDDEHPLEPAQSNYLEVRRSGRCRTVNSIYAESIGEMKRNNKKQSNLKKTSYKPNLGENQESDEFSLKITLEKDFNANYQKAILLNENGSLRTIQVFIEEPKRPERRSTRVVKIPQEAKRVTLPTPNIIKRKVSAFKSSMKEIPKEEPTSLLNIMLNAAMKIKQQPHGNQQGSGDAQDSVNNGVEPDISNDGFSEHESKRPLQSKQKIRIIQKDECNRRLAKIQMRFLNLKKRYQQIRPKIMFSLLQS